MVDHSMRTEKCCQMKQQFKGIITPQQEGRTEIQDVKYKNHKIKSTNEIVKSQIVKCLEWITGTHIQSRSMVSTVP